MAEIPQWEVTIIELRNEIGRKYKVTRRYCLLGVAETKVFRTKRHAVSQFQKWLE
jgi:hypothetical protein